MWVLPMASAAFPTAALRVCSLCRKALGSKTRTQALQQRLPIAFRCCCYQGVLMTRQTARHHHMRPTDCET